VLVCFSITSTNSLILLVLEAGIDIDVATLKLTGTRGFIIAVIGSLLPIAFGVAMAYAVGVTDGRTAFAAGATFGPTSVGIALNILRTGGILNTPTGQLIVSAAVIDDMIALIILSQLESLAGTVTVAGVLIPIISATLFLVVGGAIALLVLPGLLNKHVVVKVKEENKGKLEMMIMFVILLGLMPATYYCKASYLMGAFISGLGFCTSHELHLEFVRQFKRVLQWLMRIFFAASIGFQVPITHFASGEVIWKGLVFCVALVGKLGVGFLAPNFTQSKQFTGLHLRDCLIVGFSMAAEGEFAFVIAVFSVDSGLIDKDLYASLVLAVLLSTIIPPFLLRFTIGYYNKRAEEAVRQLADQEMKRHHDLESGPPTEDAQSNLSDSERDAQLAADIRNQTAVFLCIQTQSTAKWGLLNSMMGTLTKLGLDIIDHRCWNPRGINTTLVTEVYARDTIKIAKKGESQAALEERMEDIKRALEAKINQPDDSRVKVQRWYPGVVEEVVEHTHEKSRKSASMKKLSVEERLVIEAENKLTKNQAAQTSVTKEKTVDEILSGMQGEPQLLAPVSEVTPVGDVHQARKRAVRRRRQKMRSTPVVGGGLFGETGGDSEDEASVSKGEKEKADGEKKKWKPEFVLPSYGHKAEIIVSGESYSVRINDETLKNLRSGFSGDMLDSRGVSINGGLSIQQDSTNVVNHLQGYVRNLGGHLERITEETEEQSHEDSDTSSMYGTHSHRDNGDEETGGRY